MIRDLFSYIGGYVSAQSPIGAGNQQGTIIKGSKNVVLAGSGAMEPFKGLLSESLASGGLNFDIYGDNFAYIDGVAPQAAGGNIFMGTGKSIWGVGAGVAKYYNKSNSTLYTLGSLTSAGGQLRVWTWNGTSYDAHFAGLTPPSTGSITAKDVTGGFTGKINGTISAVFSKYRPTTGAESRPSAPTAVVAFTNQYARITFPPATDLDDGSTMFRVYVSLAGFGASGPWRFLGEYQMSAGYTPPSTGTGTGLGGLGTVQFDSGTSRYYIDVEWTDSQLLPDEPQVDFFYPPVALNCFQYGNVNVLAGTYGGLGISCSVPNYPEAFPPSSTSFLSEPVVGVIGKPVDGTVFILCKNSVWIAVWTGAPDGPSVIPRALWNDVGVQNPQAAVVVKGQLYAYTASKGICRTNGSALPDTNFAAKITDDTSAWDATKVKVGYSPQDDAVVFAHDRVMLMYHPNWDTWSAPVYLDNLVTNPGANKTIAGFYTSNGLLHVSLYDTGTTTYSLYTFNSSSGTGSNWEIWPAWTASQGYLTNKTIDRLINSADVNGQLRTRIFKNLDTSTAVFNKLDGPFAAGDRIRGWQKVNARNCKAYTVVLSGSGATGRIYGTEVHARESKIRV
jgi:hypothetical protein